MCLKRYIEYYSSSESIDFLYETDLEWPIERTRNSSRLIIACNICFYPITLEEHVLDEIRDENNITFGIVIPINKLFKKIVICRDDPLEQWRSEVYCYACCNMLSFVSPQNNNITETNFQKVSQYSSIGEQIVILWKYPLYRGSSEEAYSRFRQINEFEQIQPFIL